ncbi:MAG: electron transport complex subunit RsxC [Oscillospiraceae bacterium]|nr:electron transport complex subunit RsxC [Oscillospiraceae bacterium]
MRTKTFRGGVHPSGMKELSQGKPIQFYEPKGDLVFPLSQHIGKPAVPVVKKNDPVLTGQIIAKADGFISANIISSCSGKVKAIEPRMTTAGVVAQCIVIQNDGKFDTVPGFGVPNDDWASMTNDEIIQKIMDAGVIGLGGAGFPTHVKMRPRNPEEIDYIIANGAECEPYITCDERLMIEHSDWIVAGIKVVQKLFPHAKGIIAIEDNKPEAIKAMQAAISGESNMEIMPLHTKFPQGGERNLVHAVTNRKMESRDLPANLGCIVDNVATLTAIYHAVCCNEPLVSKGFTVTGDAVAEPANFMVRIGTDISELLEAAGGLKTQPKKVIIGGPMMGMAITSLNRPIAKSYNALVCMTEDPVEKAFEQMTNCIRCGRCVRVCPVGLVPQQMAVAGQRKDYAKYEKIHGLDCIACGSCTFICPAKRPLTQLFQLTKKEIMAQKAAAAAKK